MQKRKPDDDSLAIPRPEYPRPQFVRDTWLCLNGSCLEARAAGVRLHAFAGDWHAKVNDNERSDGR